MPWVSSGGEEAVARQRQGGILPRRGTEHANGFVSREVVIGWKVRLGLGGMLSAGLGHAF